MKKLQKEPFYQDESTLANIDCNIEYCKSLIQNSINEFSKICSSPITFEELQSCLTREPYRQPVLEAIEQLIKLKLIAGQSNIFNGLALSKAKMNDLIELPDYSVFLQILELFQKVIPTKFFSLQNFNTVFWNCYSLENGMVNVNNEVVEGMKFVYRDYIENEAEQAKLESVISLCDALNKFQKKEPGLNPEELSIKGLTIWDAQENIFTPAVKFIKVGSI